MIMKTNIFNCVLVTEMIHGLNNQLFVFSIEALGCASLHGVSWSKMCKVFCVMKTFRGV